MIGFGIDPPFLRRRGYNRGMDRYRLLTNTCYGLWLPGDRRVTPPPHYFFFPLRV
jgi:hypothetical protein